MAEVFILLIPDLCQRPFVMGEIALVSARRFKLESLANKGDEKNPENALTWLKTPKNSSVRAQIGINPHRYPDRCKLR